MVVQMNQDGTPTKVDLKDTGRYHNDPTFRAAADSAMRAVSNPRCQPWPLSPEKYNAWRTITSTSTRATTEPGRTVETPSNDQEVRHDSSRRTILGVALTAATASTARAQLTIDMTKPSFEPVPIAIVDFQAMPWAGQMAGVIRNDLQGSGLFRSIPPGSFIQQNLDANAQPRFPDWRQVGAAGLVVGSVAQVGGNIKVDFRLWDVIQGSQATGLSFTSQPSNWRRLSHIIADAIYKRVTGEEGYFDTRIAYVSETGRSTSASSASPSWTRTAPTTATSPTAARWPLRRALRRPCRRSSSWPMARTSRRPRSTCRTSTAAGAS
jgi:hypothetical protein